MTDKNNLVDSSLLEQLLGPPIVRWNESEMTFSWLYEAYKDIECSCEETINIVKRAFIMALLRSIVSAMKGRRSLYSMLNTWRMQTLWVYITGGQLP